MLVLALIASLAGCAHESTCVSWVAYDSAQAAYDDASLVVVGTVGAPEGAVTLLDERVALRPVDIEQVLKGEAPDELAVASTPLTCSSEPAADALDTDGRVVIMLTNDAGIWRTLTPYEGVLPLAAGEPLPFDVG